VIILNELRYLTWHVVWLINEDASISTVEWRETGHQGEVHIRKTMSTSINPLSGDAAQSFNDYAWEALTLGSRSAMLSHARRQGAEI